MAELRWNPMIKDWVMIASNRQNRPQMPKDWCPFCPGSGKVPDNYEVHAYDNDFPALTQNPPKPDDVATDFYKVKPSHGKCEVILFSPNHHGTLKELSDQHMKKLVDLWCARFNAMKEDKKIKYSPMVMQYLDIKANYPDTLILFRLGDFYELFFEDA